MGCVILPPRREDFHYPADERSKPDQKHELLGRGNKMAEVQMELQVC